MKLYEGIAQSLVAEGCEILFGLMGDGNLSLWGEIGRANAIRILSARHEAAAVAMADGYSRTTTKTGVCTVTCGPGLTQIGTSLSVAVRGGSSLVIIVGDIPKTERHHAQLMDQRAFVESCGARFVNVTSVDNAMDEIAEAFYAARHYRTAVVLNVSLDLQERAFEWEWDYRPSAAYLGDGIPASDSQSLETLMSKLIAAERPIIVAGRGAMAAEARTEVLELADKIGALLATSLQAKDFFLGEEFDLGISGAFASAPAEQLMSEADFVLGVGAQLGYYSTEGGLMYPRAEVARIDIKPTRDSIGFLPGLFVAGDAKRVVAELNAGLAQRGVRKQGYRSAQTLSILHSPPHRYEQPADGMDPRLLAREIAKGLPDGVLVTLGAAHFFSFPAMYMPLPAGAELQYSYNFQAVGQGLPVAIGVGAGNPGRPHVAIEGDGSLLMHLQELDTVVRFRMQLVLIIWNDSGFGAEVHKLKVRGFDPALAQWTSPDFVSIARSFGGDGALVKSERDIGPAIRAGLARGGLYVIDARVSPTVLSDYYTKTQYGIPNRAPRLLPLARNERT
jgi:acetolactate synthase I/II/III large subunit